MQGICDQKWRFLDIDIAYPASTSYYLSFDTSHICTLIETPGFLCDNLTIYGDNNYVNNPYITSPFKAISSGSKDVYHFYHSQIRMNIECVFGLLINRCAVLGTPIPINISIKKITPLLQCLCCLHNWLIDERGVNDILKTTTTGKRAIANRGGRIINAENTRVNDMLNGGAHFDNLTRNIRYQHQIFLKTNKI